ncbi:MAG: hypothetical protein IBX50_08190 [Marinospirillum sp.]|uniref:hypothetical protein n=1 Tax=Marinospirillum sp. TaxID=2183934 RepID=UPI0019E79979|nr:hypothetical protein [Marinospirillum sp.]MBE0506685.1 hypothetical protein [Marinospirillum sp.]
MQTQDTISDLIALHEQLMQETDRQVSKLFDPLPAWGYAQNMGFPTPQRSGEDNEYHPPIPGETFTGRSAIDLCRQGFLQLNKLLGQDGLTVFRLIGAMPVSSGQLTDLDALYEVKARLRKAMLPFRSHFRNDVIKAAFPEISLLQAYRLWPLHDCTQQTITRIHLTWNARGYTHGKITGQAAIDLLDALQAGDPRVDHGKYREARMALSFYRLDTEYTLIRPVRPHPRYQIQTADGQWTQQQAHLPLLCMNQVKKPEFRPLQPLSETMDDGMQRIMERHGADMLIPWLGILKPGCGLGRKKNPGA